MQSLNLGDCLRLMQTALAAPFAKTRVPFEIDLETQLPPLRVDPTRLREILLELLNNAAEAAHAHGGGVAGVQNKGAPALPGGLSREAHDHWASRSGNGQSRQPESSSRQKSS
jgi:hypothetical protein